MSLKRRIDRLERESHKALGFADEPPEWALKIAQAKFSEPTHPVARMFLELAQEEDSEATLDDLESSIPREYPEYVADPQAREEKSREHAWELVSKYGKNKPSEAVLNPVKKFFEDLAAAEPENAVARKKIREEGESHECIDRISQHAK